MRRPASAGTLSAEPALNLLLHQSASQRWGQEGPPKVLGLPEDSEEEFLSVRLVLSVTKIVEGLGHHGGSELDRPWHVTKGPKEINIHITGAWVGF